MIYVEIIASILTLLSFWLIDQKKKVGWWVSIWGSSSWIGIGISHKLWGLTALQVGLIFLAIHALITWENK